jgi:predicted DNA-binding protein
MENFYKYKTNKAASENVIQKNVLQKTLQVRIGNQNYCKLNEIAEDLNQPLSKVVRDIIESFILDLEQESWQKEIAEWKC